MSESKDFIWDDRAPAFRLMGETAALIAQKHCGVDVDGLTRQRWSDAGALMREVDTLYDDVGEDEAAIIARLVSYEDFEKLYPSLGPDELDEARRDELLIRTNRIMRLGRYVGETTSAYRYSRLRAAEARESANVAISAATDYVQDQPLFWEKFVPIYRSFAIGACALDSTLDGITDYRRGKSSVPPSLSYYSELLKLGAGPMTYGIRPLFRPSIAAQGLIMAKQRIKTRIKNGLTEHSTMQNIKTFFDK